MSIFTDNLESLVVSAASASDEIIIISGFFSIDIIENIAKQGVPTTFYYGMYLRNGISLSNYNSFKRLEATYPNLKIKIPVEYHVHTKCYIFKKSGITFNALVGSANASSSALATTPNSELLTPIDSVDDKTFLDSYAAEINNASVPFDNPIIVPAAQTKALAVAAKTSKKIPKSWKNYTGNPFSAIIPLYYITKNGPVVHNVDGLNWGNGPHASKSSDMESVLPIRKFHIENYPLLIPFNGSVGSGTGGKIQRMQRPIDMIWDDGTKMKMLFQQGGTEIPSKAKRAPGEAYRQYPKALTSNSGGSELGTYLRRRMDLPSDATVTYNDLRAYGRDYVTLTLTNAGIYELDFSV
jgi:hypothetical protein